MWLAREFRLLNIYRLWFASRSRPIAVPIRYEYFDSLNESSPILEFQWDNFGAAICISIRSQAPTYLRMMWGMSSNL